MGRFQVRREHSRSDGNIPGQKGRFMARKEGSRPSWYIPGQIGNSRPDRNFSGHTGTFQAVWDRNGMVQDQKDRDHARWKDSC